LRSEDFVLGEDQEEEADADAEEREGAGVGIVHGGDDNWGWVEVKR
jgi:hypothetical protein